MFKFVTRRNPSSKVFASKDGAQKIECFCIRYFSKTKRKSTKPITQLCFSCQNKSVCQKIVFDPAKIKIDPKYCIRHFCMKAFNYHQGQSKAGTGLKMLSVLFSFFNVSFPGPRFCYDKIVVIVPLLVQMYRCFS